DDNDQIIIGARFSSKLQSGSILRLHAIKDYKNIFELRLGLNNSNLSVDVRNENGISILSLPFADHNLNESINGEKSIGVRLKTSTNELIYSFENDMEMVARINEPLDLIDSKLEVILGSDEGDSLVGCITLVSLTLSSPLANIYTIAESDTQSCAIQGNECAERDCGDGICLELETPTCDCYGTGNAGVNCRSDVPSAQLSSSMDGTLGYQPLRGDQTIGRISISFRLNENEDEQGVLISARLISKRRIIVYVVDGKGSLQIDNIAAVGFDMDKSIKDHSLVLIMEGKKLSLQVDKMEEKSVEMDCEDENCYQFTEIHFGAEPQTSEVRRIGMTGCIWETYVDHHNILSMYYDGHPRVSSPQKLDRCNRDKEEAVIDVQEHFTSFIGHSLPQIQLQSFDEEPTDHKIGTGASLFPITTKKVKEFPSLPCNNAVGDNCRNGATCILRNHTRICLCPHGFAGSACQFTSIPRTCAEAKDFYRTPDGPTLIDVDGSGPLPKSVVDCNNGITTIINDMPEKTIVHDTVEQHSQFILSYRDFTPQQLAMMVVESEKCTQQIHYECARAALGFEKSKTQFTLAGSNRTISRMGDNDKKCGQGKCNCESDNSGEDDGILQSPNVGITKILAFRDHKISVQNGLISVGPLVCSSHPGSLTPLRFSSPAVVLLDRSFEKDLSIQFRTTSSSGVILSVGGGLTLRIKSQYSLSVSIENEMEVTVQSPIRLNNTAWHLVIIEIINNQLRLSIDNIVVVEKIEGELTQFGEIQLGDPNEGFIGCLRSLRLNNQVLDLHKETEHVENNEVHLSCPDKCHSDLCKNEAECLENLSDLSADPVCVCKIPQIQQGANCEIDINKTPPVSFHGGHLKYEDLHWTLEGEIVLSFRTDQQQGLILFTHDHLNNFLQLHIASEIAVTLTLNNLEEVFTCTVEAEPGEEYSDMEWVQIVISHVDNTTILSVNGRLCFIQKTRLLSTDPITTYAHVESELVRIPVGLHHSAAINPFLLTYLGGVQEAKKQKGQLTLSPRYDTSIRDFLGCVRGFRVGGNLIDLTHTAKGTRPEDPDLVQIGCELGCSSISCSNGGHCGVGWTNFHPEFNNKAHCNCERTSYNGDKCDIDRSLSLSNGRSVDVNIKRYIDHYPLADRSHSQTLKMAFKSNKQPNTKQTIATLHFNDGSLFEVLLNRNGSIHVGAVRGDKAEVLTFAGNFSDGYRHFIVAQFKNDSATAILIDSSRHDLPWSTHNLDLFDAFSLTLGTPNDTRYTDAQREHFDGCVSNVELDYQITAVKIEPIAELYNVSSTRWSVTSIRPEGSSILDMIQHSCGQFKEKDHLPGLPSKIDYPVWDTNFGRLIYSGLWLEGGEEDGGTNWLLIILIILVILIIIGAVVYFMCFRNKTPPKKTVEETPLNPIQPVISNPIPKKPVSNFTIPEPDSVLPEKTTDESDEEDWDRTLTEDSIGRPEEMSNLPSFNRTMPHRLSSFKRSDPTVPVNSPLYVSRNDNDLS
ncbi:itx-1, partial [Pristionchus pacificus]